MANTKRNNEVVEAVETVEAVENVNDVVEEVEQPKVEAKKAEKAKKGDAPVKVAEPVKVEEPLNDYDIIEVVAIIPGVSYKDSHTEDIYRWETAGHIEEMDFATVKNMWKHHKNYFRHMLLRPLDKRVVKKFGLENNYAKHDYLMDPKNYTRENIDDILNSIHETPNGMKMAIINKIKSMVYSGQLSDINVVKKIDTRLGLDLISMI